MGKAASGRRTTAKLSAGGFRRNTATRFSERADFVGSSSRCVGARSRTHSTCANRSGFLVRQNSGTFGPVVARVTARVWERASCGRRNRRSFPVGCRLFRLLPVRSPSPRKRAHTDCRDRCHPRASANAVSVRGSMWFRYANAEKAKLRRVARDPPKPWRRRGAGNDRPGSVRDRGINPYTEENFPEIP